MKVTKLFVYLFACLALCVTLVGLTSLAPAAKENETYEIYVGNIQVTSGNCDNVLGEEVREGQTPSVTYDAGKKVLRVTNAYIDTYSEAREGKRYSIASAEAGLTLEISGH